MLSFCPFEYVALCASLQQQMRYAIDSMKELERNPMILALPWLYQANAEYEKGKVDRILAEIEELRKLRN